MSRLIALATRRPGRLTHPHRRPRQSEDSPRHRQQRNASSNGVSRPFPKPENMREYMRTISAEPHHAGQPRQPQGRRIRPGAVQVLGTERVDREFEALMPYPTERIVELVAPERYVAKLKEPADAAGSRLERRGSSCRRSTPTRPTAT